MSETTATALITVFGCAMMILATYFAIRVMINTTKYANSKNNNSKK